MKKLTTKNDSALKCLHSCIKEIRGRGLMIALEFSGMLVTGVYEALMLQRFLKRLPEDKIFNLENEIW